MSNIMFFSIPAHGHVNPTLAAAEELVKRGHRVKYYQTEEFREKIEAAGAEFTPLDDYLPPAPEDLDQKAGKDFSALIAMVVDTTINMEEMMDREMEEFKPDCIISDSICIWGKLFAKKYNIPFISSTTTMVFNEKTSKAMKPKLSEKFRLIKGMPLIQTKIAELNERGYRVPDFIWMIQNGINDNTIVYTSEKFQPDGHRFPDNFAFVGPSVQKIYAKKRRNPVKNSVTGSAGYRPQIYISLGTILNNNIDFYRKCIAALKDLDCSVIISAGKNTDITALGDIPESFSVYPQVDQLEVLSSTDIFITHCGMNSVMESLYYGVPMVLFPQHSEEGAVADRTAELGAGVRLKKASVKNIRKAVEELLESDKYRQNAEALSSDFKKYKGPRQAADFVEKVIRRVGEKAQEDLDFEAALAEYEAKGME